MINSRSPISEPRREVIIKQLYNCSVMNDDVLNDVDLDIICCVCCGGTSEVPNEIVICDRCESGYHQRCHDPEVPASLLTSDLEWICGQCTTLSAPLTITTNKKLPVSTVDDGAATTQQVQLSFPYELNSLTWDAQHRNNLEQTYCYCGGPSTGLNMIQCCQCRQLFHEACLFEQPLLHGDRFFMFICAICNRGTQSLKRLELKWADVVHLALFNLSKENNKTYYDVNNAILPFIESNWEWMRVTGEIANASSEERKAAVLSTLQNNRTKFKCGCETKKKMSLWGLRTNNPPPVAKVSLAVKQAQKMKSSFSPLPNMPQRRVAKQKKLNDSKYFQQSSNGSLSTLIPTSKETHSVKNLKKNFKSLEAQKTTGRVKKYAPNGSDPNGALTSRPANKFASGRNCVISKESGPFSAISLNAMIPLPENFEGKNNPFRNLNRRPTITQLLMPKKNRDDFRVFCLGEDTRKRPSGRQPSIVREHFAVSKSKGEVFFKRVVDGGLKENDRLTHQSLFAVQDTKLFAECSENFKILAKRVTIHGHVEYLIEWEGIGSTTSTSSNDII